MHSKKHAITPMQFESLVEQTYDLKRFWGIETRLILFLTGRLGMRRGEVTHLNESWIDWREKRIIIPEFHPCSRGRDGGICGDCRGKAAQRTRHNEGLTVSEAESEQWSPKTECGVREIPFGFDTRTEMILEQFFDHFDKFMYTAGAINRRINRVIDMSDRVDYCHPHGLRSTAATFHAGRGIDVFALKNLMGWKQLDVALRYVGRNPDRLDYQLRHIHR